MSNIELDMYKKGDYSIGQWSGGTTTELAIYPQNSQYSERCFLWRLSSATVEVEESDFTSLPDYNRILIVLVGEVVLVHKEKRAIRLAQYEQDRFSGAYETKSFGKITDFNLMVRKGSEGFAEVISLTDEYIPLDLEKASGHEKISQSFYCAEGFGIISLHGKSHMVKEGELLTITGDLTESDELSDFGVMGQGKIIRTQVYFNREWSEVSGLNRFDEPKKIEELDERKENQEKIVHEAIEKPKEENIKATFEDLKWAALICWSNFRGGKLIFRCMKKLWYDEKLQRAINRLDGTYLLYIIALIGFGIAGFAALEVWGADAVLSISIAWFAFDLVILNPLVYLKWLPKPVKKHIKNKDEMTEEEKIIEAVRRGENVQADKILKKYEITGRNKYID